MFAAETRIFASNDEWRHVTVYEDLSPLPQDRYERGPLRIIMKASDDTNPEKNGRRYFVVLP
ncbi:hypothetical protein MA20_41030 [Bradyrhizobium japonicum]|uniref:Uncharacterized protein n=1 Tax=Bradyrhizobium japonicum TaxID=375 RepID=A0A0A3XHJ7_BRAJP|nr:hypothetical protein MA20_41030 [Bradyrhizobium japonicum]